MTKLNARQLAVLETIGLYLNRSRLLTNIRKCTSGELLELAAEYVVGHYVGAQPRAQLTAVGDDIREAAVWMAADVAYAEHALRSSPHGVCWGGDIHTICADQTNTCLSYLRVESRSTGNVWDAPIHSLRPATAQDVPAHHAFDR